MSATSAGAAMALTKQVQFMRLTTDISGCPEVYSDFAESMKAFSLDFSSYINTKDLGMPNMDTIRKMKQKYMEQAKILPEYCHALVSKGQEAADQVLIKYPDAAAGLLG